jgi:hypothetical protein
MPPFRLADAGVVLSREVLAGAAGQIMLLQDDEVLSLDEGQGAAHGHLG